MEHPKREISYVIRLLTEGSPVQQRNAIEIYFKPDASFIHPVCRVPSFPGVDFPLLCHVNSRLIISLIYRWYKILSPRITIHIESIDLDHKSNTAYCELRQEFSPIFIPFYNPSARLTTKLILHQNLHNGKYYIQTQEDLYQPNQIFKYFFPGSAFFISLWQYYATFVCIVGALVLYPITWLEQTLTDGKKRVNGISKDI